MHGKIIGKLKNLTKHENILLTQRGNSAILAALSCAKTLQPGKNDVLMPDQGGWFTYKKYSERLKLNPVELKTDYGVISLKELKEKSKGASCLIYSQPAGYFAGQPAEDIYNICRKNGCMVIMDVTGSIGTKYCNGDLADMIVCSFGRWKPANVGYGGFISAKEKDFPVLRELSNKLSFDEKYSEILFKKLSGLGSRHKLFERANKKIKEDLKGYRILHRDKWGINVIVKFSSDGEKEKIIKYCDEAGLEYALCPRQIRVNEKAVSIEVKRLE